MAVKPERKPMNKKVDVHIVERGSDGEFKLTKGKESSAEPPRNVQEMIDRLHRTHGPTRKLPKKGEKDG
jgi:hypothetical protein